MTDVAKGTAYIDGEYKPISEAKISVLDWGFLHSDATYDVVHVWNSKFFRLDDHLDRYFSGMKKLHLTIPYSRNELKNILSHCVSRSGLKDAYVEMITTRGQPQSGSRDPRSCTNQFIAFAIPFVWVTKPNTSLNVFISQRQRIPLQSIDPVIKNYHWLDLVMGQYEAFEQGNETVFLVDKNGNITEGPGFNIFVIKDQTIITPATGILHGITRKSAIELVIENGYKMIEGDVSPQYARDSDEVFATSTAGGIMPITTIDNQRIGNGEIGPITQKLQERYWLMHDDLRYSSVIEYSS